MAMVQVLCARNQVWLTNEKGALALAAAVPGAPTDFAERVNAALIALNVDALQTLAAELNGPVSRWP